MGTWNGELVDGEKELHESAERAAGQHHDFDTASLETKIISGRISEGDAWEWGIHAGTYQGQAYLGVAPQGGEGFNEFGIDGARDAAPGGVLCACVADVEAGEDDFMGWEG